MSDTVSPAPLPCQGAPLATGDPHAQIFLRRSACRRTPTLGELVSVPAFGTWRVVAAEAEGFVCERVAPQEGPPDA